LNLNKLTIANSTISGNSAGGGGGIVTFGTETDPSSLTLTNSTVSGNTATSNGGGIDTLGGVTNVIRSTISGNTAGGEGGGVSLFNYSDLTLTNSTVSGNRAQDGGGGIHGGESGTRVVLTHSTVSRNTSDTRGGGVYIADVLERTLISGNSASQASEVYGSARTTNFNLFGHSGLTNAQAFEGFTPGPTDITATSNGNDPTALSNILNTTLANNGGPTRTHALVAGSPAIDTVTDGTCPPPATDQRGVRRPQDGNNDGAAICDTGSFERQ
jgi:hypothetical protein